MLTSFVSAACGSSPTAPTPPRALVLSCPANVDVPSPRGAAVPVSFATPVATGGTAPVTTTCIPAAGSTFTAGPTPITCTATDAAGARATCGFTVSVTAIPVLSQTRFLAFGDSLTEGKLAISPAMLIDAPAHSYPTKLHAALVARYPDQQVVVINEGFGGERASESVSRFTDAVETHRPEVVLLMHGVNDLNGTSPGVVQSTVDALEELVKAARSRGLTTLVATLPPLAPPKANCPECVEPFNERLQAMVMAKGAVLVDVYAAWGNRPDLMGPDGIHPTEAGYELIANTFFDAIRRALELPPQ